ncbi:formylglycine-generating enzyme family protein [Tenacibaculum finnmarkense]|uniref:formylglycine-generating enzyme family protein n=1 Tax=Tenacibaculum finnmarkense TaxID=2781243 RepID=UPI001EFAEC5F|nr:formylglycine-generating enzyme family protein [Tenacibaculum finnmarkense]MCG8859758.1 formylglycine-generating enzyme family protein [Tenacibaculum finnmarkense]
MNIVLKIVAVTAILFTSCSEENTGKEQPKIDSILVEGGSFLMGRKKDDTKPVENWELDEFPEHKVSVATFYMGTYEVTNAEYAAFLNEKGNQIEGQDSQGNATTWLNIERKECQIEQIDGTFKVKEGAEKLPVVVVTWYGSRAYSDWVGGRLPTEAEWEYAAKGGAKTNDYLYAGSNNLDEVAWFRDNSKVDAHPVGEKTPNELGIYDMSGNVTEWCQDKWYNQGYIGTPTDGSAMLGGEDDNRIIRGGNFHFGEHLCQVFSRLGYPRSASGSLSGFRVAYDKK